MRIEVFPLPDLVPEDAAPDAAFFIDALRATSTMTVALDAGAQRIIPVADPQETLRLRDRMIADGAVSAEQIRTGGERKGTRIAGFDFGNSPREYTPESVGGKTLLFSTTNGTRAILSLHAPTTRKFLASYLNAETVVERILSERFPSVAIVCAGTDRQYTEEDLLLAGLLTDRLCERIERENRALGHFGAEAEKIALNIQAETVRYQWREFFAAANADENADEKPFSLEKPLITALRASRGGKNLLAVGLGRDIPDVCRLDTLALLPEYRMGDIRADR